MGILNQYLDGPIVSVGIPTYNRPNGLRNTLNDICNQSYKNLEILISDNGSNDYVVKDVVDEYLAKDKRISYVKHDVNQGILFNFEYVLKHTSGQYFMWAADDDRWEPSFISECLKIFQAHENDYVAVGMETQYFSNSYRFEFFAEGVAFYDFYSKDSTQRILHMINQHYGNLYNCIFTRRALMDGSGNIFSHVKLTAINELSLLICLAKFGNFKIIPNIGIYKSTNKDTYVQAKWEATGGWLPKYLGVNSLRTFLGAMKYHRLVLNDLVLNIQELKINHNDELKIIRTLKYFVWRHFLLMIAHYKSVK